MKTIDIDGIHVESEEPEDEDEVIVYHVHGHVCARYTWYWERLRDDSTIDIRVSTDPCYRQGIVLKGSEHTWLLIDGEMNEVCDDISPAKMATCILCYASGSPFTIEDGYTYIVYGDKKLRLGCVRAYNELLLRGMIKDGVLTVADISDDFIEEYGTEIVNTYEQLFYKENKDA